MVLVVQAADQLRNVSQDILGPIVGLAMTKELGPVLMAFLLAGRAGSAMAAELGSMTVYDEINALRTLDIDPVRFLVMPRFLASAVMLPVKSASAIARRRPGTSDARRKRLASPPRTPAMSTARNRRSDFGFMSRASSGPRCPRVVGTSRVGQEVAALGLEVLLTSR